MGNDRQAHTDIARKLRDAGLRATPQRCAVWAAFDVRRHEHLTAEDVFERARRELPELARATVYNALGELARADLLSVVEGPGAVLYDSNLDPKHHHFYCRSCNRLFDVHLKDPSGLNIADDPGFVVERRAVVLQGLCPKCSASA